MLEELGLIIKADRLLVVEHQPPRPGRPSMLQFVFAADSTIDPDVPMKMQPDEIEAVSWLTEDQAVERHDPIVLSRAAAMFAAERDRQVRYIDAERSFC